MRKVAGLRQLLREGGREDEEAGRGEVAIAVVLNGVRGSWESRETAQSVDNVQE
jgi:hypothetical protein